MSLQEPQPPEDAIRATTSHGAMQRHEKGEVDPTSQQQPRQNQSVPEAAKDRTTQTSAAALSAQGPIVSGKLWAIQRFWAEHVSVVVDFETCRDHLGTAAWNTSPHTLRMSLIISRVHGRGGCVCYFGEWLHDRAPQQASGICIRRLLVGIRRG
ncbi:hypothetical protein CH63R_05906 [Colletotrichum higginsianum IMI 349063]|uniref:Uncharacterized protein n=1 Tax=Colletotrichum higginsianum (strain IMI 349063) TaxID=759273 RepID=A0A1B7YEA5_COLHI|nr:hypothetical protein CH63R_05906 [Colletotrichum higginsianum IMI 349063]OBR10214.1 hypothetical protein CH63R_05906 [Colletotrichum higginsianum IMI 349063]